MDQRDKALIVFALVLLIAGGWWCLCTLFKGETEAWEPLRLDLVEDAVRAEFVADTPRFVFGTLEGKNHYKEADFRWHDQSLGWLSWRYEERGVDGGLLLGGRGAFTMTVLDPVPTVLTLEGCAMEGGEGAEAELRLFLNGRLKGKALLRRGRDFQTLRFEVDPSELTPGKNRFVVEVDGGVEATLPGFFFPVTLSAFFVSVTLEGITGPIPPRPVVHGRGGRGEKSIIQPSGTLLEYYLLPEWGDRFKARLLARGGPLRAALFAARPKGGAAELFSERLEPGGGGKELDIDLSAFAGDACRITLVSGEPGDTILKSVVLWEAPRIVKGASGPDRTGKKPSREAQPASPPKGASPNIAVVLLDAASAFFFPCFDGKRTVAPAVQALASESVLFAQAVTPAPYTLPSVGSLMTGLLPDRHGVVWNANRDGVNLKLSGGLPTLASVLKEAGYATFGVVANPNAAALYGYGKGFDRYEELFKDPKLWNEGVTPEPVLERAKALLAPHASGKAGPFFLYLHFFQPHAPYTPPLSYVDRFAGPYEGPADGSRAVIDGFKETGDPSMGEQDFEHLADLYAANLAYVDDAVGRFFAWLRSEGLFEEMLIVLLSDHGEAFGEHRSIEHGHHLYEEALRIPWMIKLPGGRLKGLRVKEPVSLTDLASTLAAAASAPHEALARDGMNLLPLLEETASWPDRVHMARSDIFRPSYSLRWRGYQYIFDSLNRREELYFLPDDPGEERNLMDKNPVVGGYLRSRLCRLLCDILSEASGERVELDPEFIQSVNTLGYTGGKAPGTAAPEEGCPLLRR